MKLGFPSKTSSILIIHRKQTKLRNLSKKLKWSATNLNSFISQQSQYQDQEDFFQDLYSQLKQTFGLIAAIWYQAFNTHQEGEGFLNLKQSTWSSTLHNLAQILKNHKIENQEISSLLEEDLNRDTKPENKPPKISRIESRRNIGNNLDRYRHFDEQLLFAVKDQNSYLTVTKENHIMLIDQGDLVYTHTPKPRPNGRRGRSFSSQDQVKEVVYCSDKRAYFLLHNYGLFRKDIDRKEAYLFMNLYGGFEESNRLLQYSLELKRLVYLNQVWRKGDAFNENLNYLSVLNLKTKKVEAIIPNHFENEKNWSITDFVILDEKNEKKAKVVIAYSSGRIAIDTLHSRGQKAATWRNPDPSKEMKLLRSISVCPDQKSFLVYSHQEREQSVGFDYGAFPVGQDRYQLFAINESGITLMAALDDHNLHYQRNHYIGYRFSYLPCFYRYDWKGDPSFIQFVTKVRESCDPDGRVNTNEHFFSEIRFEGEAGNLISRTNYNVVGDHLWRFSRMVNFDGVVYYIDPKGYLNSRVGDFMD